MPKAVADDQKEMIDSVTEALVSLGYRRPDARAKVEAALELLPDVRDEQALIREVFRSERGR